MKTIQTGNIFRVYDNSMKVYDQLPPASYLVSFDKNEGFYLSLYNDIEIKEKVYGVHEAKVDKTLASFHEFNRNLGIILSGAKGIGKSLFAKLLSKKGIEQGFPLIIVNSYIPGVGEYINNIEQEVIVLFDEFDKVFKEKNNGSSSPQAELLTLFDGIAQGKKLFVVTCNDITGLNNFLVNRPGRFHYHLRFSYPEGEEIKEYLMDALDEKYYGEINAVIAFSKKTRLNYDCLRAIAFELNHGLTFKEAIKDLNIVNIENEIYTLTLYLDNGEKLKARDGIDMFSSEETLTEFEDPKGENDIFEVYYTPSDNTYDVEGGVCYIEGSKLKLELENYLIKGPEVPEFIELYNKYKDVKATRLEFKRKVDKSIRYF